MMQLCLSAYVVILLICALFWWGAFRVARQSDEMEERWHRKARRQAAQPVPEPLWLNHPAKSHKLG